MFKPRSMVPDMDEHSCDEIRNFLWTRFQPEYNVQASKAELALSEIVWHESNLIRDNYQKLRQLKEGVEKIVRDLSCDSGTTWPVYVETVFERSRTLLYGDWYKDGSVSKHEKPKRLQYPRVRAELFANITSVEELKYLMWKFKQVLDYIFIPEIKLPNFSVSENFRSSVLNALNSQDWEEVESLVIPIALGFLGRARACYVALVIAALLLLSRLYQYAIGLLDRGGGRIYSSGSLEFRSIYISIVLFQGAYIWIKFRDVAPESNQRPSKGLRRKCRRSEGVYYGNFEPRFKPLGSKRHIYVGLYEKEEDALACNQILAFWYGKQGAQGQLPLGDGSTYPIPGMPEEIQRKGPEEKEKWAKATLKEVLTGYQLLQEYLSCEAHPTGNALPPGRPESLDVGARVIVPSGSIGVQADYAHPLQLWDQAGDSLCSVSPSNHSLNVAPEAVWGQHLYDTPSDGCYAEEEDGEAYHQVSQVPDNTVADPARHGVYPRLENPDAGVRVIVPSGRIGVQADEAQPFQLCTQGGDLVPSASPSSHSAASDWQRHFQRDGIQSDGVGGGDLNLTPHESNAGSQPEAATNILTPGTGESDEQPLEPQRPETPLQENQANDSAVNMVCQQLQIQHLKTHCSSLQSQLEQQQQQQLSRMQQMETKFLEFKHHQEYLLLQNQKMKSRIQEQDSRISELESANDVLKSADITRKRRYTCRTSSHGSRN